MAPYPIRHLIETAHPPYSQGAAWFPPVSSAAPSAAHSPGRQGLVSAGRRTPLLCGDQLVTVRRAVAETLPDHQPRLKARILAGEADRLPLMTAAFAAAERIVEGYFS